MSGIFLSKNIKKARVMAGLSQKTLAEKIDLSEKTVSAYETSRAIPPSSTLGKISIATGVSLSELMGVTEPVNNHDLVAKLDEMEERLSNIEQILIKLLNK